MIPESDSIVLELKRTVQAFPLMPVMAAGPVNELYFFGLYTQGASPEVLKYDIVADVWDVSLPQLQVAR